MDNQTEALDLSKGVCKELAHGEKPEETKGGERKTKAEDMSPEPARKRRRVGESDRAVMKWLTENKFDKRPETNDIAESNETDVASNSNNSPKEASKPPRNLSPPTYPQMARMSIPFPAVVEPTCGVVVHLQERHLWTAFNNTGTEMIINKSGRRMFPYVTVQVEGLDPNELYSFYLEVFQVDENCYKYVNQQWVPVGAAETSTSNPPVAHGDSPKSGSFWMKNPINFASVKITNTQDKSPNKIFLRSMHKYMTRIHIIQSTSNMTDLSRCPKYIFNLPETSFIAVTAYKNKAVTYMKIMNNPFAKPYRESSSEAPPRARCLRKLLNAKQAEEQKEALEVKPSRSPVPPAPRVNPVEFPRSPLPGSQLTHSPLPGSQLSHSTLSSDLSHPHVPQSSQLPHSQYPSAMWLPHPGIAFPPTPPHYYYPTAPMFTPYSPYFRPFETNHVKLPMSLT